MLGDIGAWPAGAWISGLDATVDVTSPMASAAALTAYPVNVASSRAHRSEAELLPMTRQPSAEQMQGDIGAWPEHVWGGDLIEPYFSGRNFSGLEETMAVGPQVLMSHGHNLGALAETMGVGPQVSMGHGHNLGALAETMAFGPQVSMGHGHNLGTLAETMAFGPQVSMGHFDERAPSAPEPSNSSRFVNDFPYHDPFEGCGFIGVD